MEEKGRISMDGYAVKNNTVYQARHFLKGNHDDTDAKKIKDFIDGHDFCCVFSKTGRAEVTVTPKSF